RVRGKYFHPVLLYGVRLAASQSLPHTSPALPPRPKGFALQMIGTKKQRALLDTRKAHTL
ncbi:hypothetical protein, partial [Vibrio anguillarum]|uniref:hypothetical protein n=1 Tax=Vibrio anguillarum TaxID=55601 RepID=UPI001BE4B24F